MSFEDCIRFANENRICYIASVENNQPRVRAFALWYADRTGFYFQTMAFKDIYQQLKENPKVEVCFFRPDNKGGTMMRIAGRVEFLDDINLKKKVVNDRKFLKEWGFTPENPDLIIFRISKGEAYFWTPASNFEPKKVLKFGYYIPNTK